MNLFAQQGQYVLQVRCKQSGKGLAGATIHAVQSDLSRICDSNGNVQIAARIAEKQKGWQVSAVGYRTAEFAISKRTYRNILFLEPLAEELSVVIISSSANLRMARQVQMGTDIITSAEAKRLPALFGEVDIIKLLQLKPGVKNGGEGFSGFYVRGGGSDQNLVLLDNVPVYNPNHLMGIFSVFNPDAVSQVKLYKAAYPAAYGGRLSSVLDVSMNAGSFDSIAVSGGVGILSTRLSVESPIQKGKSSIIVSARRTYFDLFTRMINKTKKGDASFIPLPSYSFGDLNLRSDWQINQNNTVWISAYAGSDNFHSNMEGYTNVFNWGNRTASANWKKKLSAAAHIQSSIFYSGYRYTLQNSYANNALELQAGINTTGLKVQASFAENKQVKWSAGMEVMLHQMNVGDYRSTTALSSIGKGEKINGNESAIFVNASNDEKKAFAWNAGFRFSGFKSAQKIHFNPEPRIGLRQNIGRNGAIKFSYTRMAQYLHLASLSSASLPTDVWHPSTQRTKPQLADQLSMGWSQTLFSDNFLFSVEAYHKWMYNQIEFRDGTNLFGNPKIEDDFVYGRGESSGIEFLLEKKKGNTTGWIGYTLSKAIRKFKEINYGEAFYPRYDRRHDFSLVVMHRFNPKYTLSGSWIYGSGSYTTVPVGRFIFQNDVGGHTRSITPVYAKRGNYRLPAVHRLDISLVMALKSVKHKQDITFSLYNVYSRRNPFFMQFREVLNAEGFTTIQPTLISLFPLLPGVTYNFAL